MMGAKLFPPPSKADVETAAAPAGGFPQRTVFANAGEPVTTEDGKVICYVKNPLTRYSVASFDDFHLFSQGEEPWRTGEIADRRCTRANPKGPGLQICINGEWRP